MRNYWIILLSVLSWSALAATPEENSHIITLYSEPNINSKHIAVIAANKAVMPIFEQKDWVKVANPENGDTGWTLKSYLTGHPLVWHYIKQEKKPDNSQSYQAVGYQFNESNTPTAQTEQKQIAAEGKQIAAEARQISKEFDQHIQTMQSMFEQNMEAFDKERQQMQAEFNKAFDEMQQSFDKPLKASPPPEEKSWWEKFKEKWK